MGITCARNKGSVAPSSEMPLSLSRHGSDGRKKRRSRNFSNPGTGGRTSVTCFRADACTGCDDLSEVLCPVRSVAAPIPELMRGELLRSGAEKPSTNLRHRRDSNVQTGSPLAGTPSARRYPLYCISHDDDNAGYTVIPFKSMYCLHRATDVAPASRRAIVTHAHAATAKQPSAPTAASTPKSHDRGGRRDATPPKAARHSEVIVATATLSRPSLVGLRRGFSFGIISDGMDDRLSRQADKVSFTSIFPSGLVLQPESPPDSVAGDEASSIFPRMTNGTETDESSSTAFTSQITLSRRHTFGVMMPTGYSQVVEHTEDGGAWEPAVVSSSAAPDVCQPWRKPMSATTALSATEKEEQRAVLNRHKGYHYCRYVDRRPQRERGAAAAPPCVTSRHRSKVGRQWPQPLMEGPKSNFSRSRPFNVEATLGCSVRSARFVPSPDWERVDVMEEEQMRLARSLKAYQQRLAEWERAQAAH